MAEIMISMADYPLVVLALPEKVELADVENLGRKVDVIYKKALETQVRVVVIVDASRLAVNGFSADARLHLARISDDSLKKYPGVRVGEAIVSTSGTVRAVLKAHNLFRRTALEQKICPSLADARVWGKALLARLA